MSAINEINFKVNVTYGDSSLSDQNNPEARLIMFIIWGIILPLVAVAGLIGNILTILVLWRREMHSTTILYLRGMVISDTGILIGSVITLTPLSCANYLHEDRANYFRDIIYPAIHTPGYYIMMALQQCNVWITVSVSVERYIAICHPFRAARIITRRKTIIVLTTVVIISLLYNIPHIFATRVSPCGSTPAPAPPPDTKATVIVSGVNSVGSNVTATSARPLILVTTTPQAPPPPHQCLVLATTDFGNTHVYLKYRTVMYSIIIYIIPLIALVILNFFLIKELMIMQQRRSGTNIHDENEANLSLVLVLIVIVFICCQTPGLVSQFDLIPVDMFMYYLSFSNLLFTLNSAVNFLIYTAFGRKFRLVLLRVFRHICSKNRRPSQASFRMTQYTDAEFDTCDATDTQCTALRNMSCYKKEVKDDTEKGEALPLNTVTTTQNKSLNGSVRSTNSKNELDPAPKTDGSDVINASNFETIETTAILTHSKSDLDICHDGRNGNSWSLSQEINSNDMDDASTQANSKDNFYC